MSTSYSYYLNNNHPNSYIESNHYYYNNCQQQEKDYQYQYCDQSYYYTQEQPQYQQMNFNNGEQFTQTIYPTNAAYQMPLFQLDDTYAIAESGHDNGSSNVLQDDNFSIVTASDLYYTNTSPSLLSTTQLTPFSSPSPQISAITGDAAFNYSEDPFNNQYTASELFAPVHEVQPSANKNIKASNATASKTRTASSATTPAEKKHICPVCSHRSKRRHNLVEHMLTHNPHRPKSFLCGHCSRPFARKYDMKRHEKIHSRK